MRNRLQLLLQGMLILVTSLLGIVTNYATGEDDVPLVLKLLERVAVPAIGLLIVAMIVVQVVVYRLEHPGPPRIDWPRDRVPYPGLDAFDEDEAAVFFGRATHSEDVARRLHGPADEAADRFHVLVGASGSGKSSLVRAGVMPRLRNRRWVVLPAFAPGPSPMAALAAAVAQAAGAQESATTVLRRLRQNPGALATELAKLRGGRFRRLILVVDQAEELLTLAGDRERDVFLEALHDCLRREPSVRVLATLRVDFLGDFLATRHGALFRHPLAIGALGTAELAQAVEKPGELVGMRFAPGVVDAIVREAGTKDALPLLAYLLQELYFAAGPGETVTEELYRRHGGVAGALGRQADHAVAELESAGMDIDFALRTLLRFVTVQGEDVARRRVALSELGDRERQVVDSFVDARLLISDVHPELGPCAQVAHEALFRQWAPLRQEVTARAEQLRQRAELERWAEDWERAGRSDDYLLTGERLTRARTWLEALRETGQTSEAARLLVETSQRHDAAFLGRVADGIGQYVLGAAESHPERSLLLSLAALDECTPTAAARRGLMTALASSHLKFPLDGHTDTVRDVAWSPDGRLIATASRDGTARIFDAAGGRCLHVLPTPGAAMVEGVAWSPDAARVATVGREHVVRVWNARTGDPQHVLTGAGDVCRQVAWSPDARWIAATARDGAVRVWEAETGRLAHELRGHSGDVWGVAWSPDSSRLATASHDQTARVWDLGRGETVTVLDGHTDFVEGVAWSPDGRHVATGSGDHTMRLFDADSGDLRLLVRGHTDYVWNVAWSPDGRLLASASSDRTVRIVDASDASVVAVLRGHTDTVWGVAWSPDGTTLATSSTDGTGRVWALRPKGAEQVLIDVHRRPVNQAQWHHDGARVVTASDDGVLRVWEAATGRLLAAPFTHTDRLWSAAWSPLDGSLAVSGNDGLLRCTAPDGGVLFEQRGPVVESLAWSPDGSRLAVGDHDGAVRVLSARDGVEWGTLTGHQDWVGRVAWSPSGRYLASVSDDRTCRLWDTAEYRQLTVLRGHEGYVDDVAWSPDEARVVTASGDWTAAVWEAGTGRRLEVLKGHEGRVRAVAWSPDGRFIATGSDDRTLRLWSAATLEEVGVAGVHQDKVASVAWSKDGSRLLTASFDGTVRIWSAAPDLDRLSAEGRNRVFRVLTDDERRHHMLPPTA
ncbi:AAA family ATPase [Streptomyces sp. NPDC052644]